MRINELTGYKSNPAYKQATDIFSNAPDEYGMTPRRFTKLMKFKTFLEQNGFKYINHGSFGAVFERPGYPWVFKIFNRDPAYLHFLKYAMAHQGNPHLPKIKGRPFKIDSKTYAVRMEKLQGWSSSFEVKTGDRVSLADMLRWWRPPINLVQEEFLRSHNAAGLIPVLTALANLCSGKHYTLDLHQGNIMRRGNCLVIVDPLVDDMSMQHTEPSQPLARPSRQTKSNDSKKSDR